jgi:hypothetical protein
MMSLTPAVPPGASIDGSDKHPPGFARINELAIDAGALESLLPELGSFSEEIRDLARNAAKMKAEVDGKVAELRDFQWSIHAVRVEVEQGQAALAKDRNLLAEEIAQSTAALEARQANLAARSRTVEDRAPTNGSAAPPKSLVNAVHPSAIVTSLRPIRSDTRPSKQSSDRRPNYSPASSPSSKRSTL